MGAQDTRCPDVSEVQVGAVGRVEITTQMTPDLWLVPASVELHRVVGIPKWQLLVVWTNGQREKFYGPLGEMREIQAILLQAMSEQSTVNVGQWPAMQLSPGRE